MITLPAATTALVLIDLQNGILGRQIAPYSGAAVLEKGKELAQRFRAAGAPVVLVNVGFAPDFRDALKAPVDRPFQAPPGGFPEGWSDLADGLAEPSDIRITKRQWGAFYGTELDLQLRRRGVKTIVLGGIATNMGVESTARAAHEHGYEVVLAEDATTSLSAEMHAFAYDHIFPMLGRVTTVSAIALQE
ncbi:hydrolase [Acetobacter farinalis]|uniref:Hydrolase n=1 Tax=Acetobacter farinalis TaxID=1260984 RepID=A0ABT3Q793_9PROT|nr:hydrolase [Acetobacter farinalis]MCX2561163.1 hydrolase [Acetobacter farinalis]NHO29867.1 hydrolase [Acetobacter farinalis]